MDVRAVAAVRRQQKEDERPARELFTRFLCNSVAVSGLVRSHRVESHSRI